MGGERTCYHEYLEEKSMYRTNTSHFVKSEKKRVGAITTQRTIVSTSSETRTNNGYGVTTSTQTVTVTSYRQPTETIDTSTQRQSVLMK